MDINLVALVVIYFLINLLAFGLMLADKMQSRKKEAKRISEGMLFFMAAAFGSIGVYGGMFLFHHKNRKWYFIIGIPLLMLQNIVFLSVVYNFLNSL
ncbi:MAG: DUF1294 domain-containing protein [Candidatus Moraniibacteriota bacterium]